MPEDNSKPTPEQETLSKTQTKNNMSGICLPLAIIAILLAGVSSFQWYKAQELTQVNDASISELKTMTQLNHIKLQALELNNGELLTRIQMLTQQNDPTHIALSEVASWVRSAQTSLMLNNARTALLYLQSANSQLSALNSAKFQDVQSALVDDINTLKNAAPMNAENLIMNLDSLAKNINELPTLFKPLMAEENKSAPSPENPYESLNWKQKLRASLDHLKSFVIIRHNSQLPVLTPAQQDLLKTNLQFKILETEWAVMTQQETLYHYNLGIISEWLQNHYQQSSATTALIAQVKDLEEAHLTMNLVSLAKVLSLIEAHLSELSPAPSTNSSTPTSSLTTPSEASATPINPAPKDTQDNAEAAAPPPTTTTPTIHKSVEA